MLFKWYDMAEMLPALSPSAERLGSDRPPSVDDIVADYCASAKRFEAILAMKPRQLSRGRSV